MQSNQFGNMGSLEAAAIMFQVIADPVPWCFSWLLVSFKVVALVIWATEEVVIVGC